MRTKNFVQPLQAEYGIQKNSFKSIRAKVQTQKKQLCQDLWNQLSVVQSQLKKHEQIQQSQKSSRSSKSLLFKQRKMRTHLSIDRNNRQKSTQSCCLGLSLSTSLVQNQQKLDTTIKTSISKPQLKISNHILKRFNSKVENQKTQKKMNSAIHNVQKNQNQEINRSKVKNLTQLLQMTNQTFQCLKFQFRNDQNKSKRLNKLFKELILMIQI